MHYVLSWQTFRSRTQIFCFSWWFLCIFVHSVKLYHGSLKILKHSFFYILFYTKVRWILSRLRNDSLSVNKFSAAYQFIKKGMNLLATFVKTIFFQNSDKDTHWLINQQFRQKKTWRGFSMIFILIYNYWAFDQIMDMYNLFDKITLKSCYFALK